MLSAGGFSAAKVNITLLIDTKRVPSAFKSSAFNPSDNATDNAFVSANTSHLLNELIPEKQDITINSFNIYTALYAFQA